MKIGNCTSVTVEGNDISGNETDWYGGGIYCDESPAIIRNNTITRNASAYYGGAMYSVSHLPSHTYENNLISGNTAVERGGGIDCRSDANIIGNLFTGNSSHRGGGISLSDSSPTFTNNVVTHNLGTWGGGIYCDNTEASISNSLIVNNTADWSGGGIYCSDAALTLTNNTLVNNSADWGGGIYCYSLSDQTIANTILWDNSAITGQAIWIGDGAEPSTVSISYSVVEGGQDSVSVYMGCTLNWGAGMKVGNPYFADSSSGDFHLTYYSSCRDSGDNTAADLLDQDFEGDPRISDTTIDIGADEFHTHLYCTGDFTPNGEMAGKFIGHPGCAPVGLFIGSGVMNIPLQHMWGDFYLESPWIVIPLFPIPSNGLLAIPETLPASPAPYDIPMQALIGDELTNLFVLEVR